MIKVEQEIVRERRKKFAAHCFRSKEEIVGDLLLWRPNHGHSKVGKPRMTYIHQLTKDVGIPIEEIKTAMEDRDVWRERVYIVRATRPIR